MSDAEFEDIMFSPYPEHKEPIYDEVTGRNIETTADDSYLEEEE